MVFLTKFKEKYSPLITRTHFYMLIQSTLINAYFCEGRFQLTLAAFVR